MSEPIPEPTPESLPKPTKKVRLKKPGRWRRRLIWTLTILLLLGFAGRALVPLALPTVLQRVAGTFGLACTYDHLELNAFSGDAGIWGIKVTPSEGGPPILETEYCHGNISVLALLKGKLNVWRAEADGVDVNLDRNADGHIPLLDRFIAATASKASTAPAPSTPAAAGTSQPIDLSSPLRLDALRLGHIRVHIHDRGISPEVDTELAMDLRLSNLGSTTSPAKFEMNLSADPVLDSLKVTGEGTSGGKNLTASINLLARGVRLKSAAGYLKPLGIVPIGDSITLRASGSVKTSAAPNDAEGFTGSVGFDHLSASVDGSEALALDNLSLTADAIDTKSIHLGKLLIDGVRANAARGADGNLRALGVEYVGVSASPDGNAEPPASTTASGPAANSAAPSSPASQGPPAIVASLLAEPWSIGEVAIRNARIDLHDHGVSPEVNLSLVAEEFSARNIDHDPQNLNTSITLSGMMHAAGVVRDIKLAATAQPFAKLKQLHATLAIGGIRPDAVRPYLDLLGLESELKNASLTTGLDAKLAIDDSGDLSADVTLGKTIFKDDAELLSLNGVAVTGASLDPATGKIAVDSVEVSGPGITASRERTGNFTALGFHTKPRQADKTAAAAEKATIATVRTAAIAAKELPHLKVEQGTTIAALPEITLGSFVWKDIRVNLQDKTQQPPVALVLSDVGVEMKNLTTELNNAGNVQPGHIHAWLAAADIAKRLDFVADVTPRTTGLDFDADVNGTGISLAGLKPYLKPLGVEPTLVDGRLTLHAKGAVDQSADKKLTASLFADHMSYRDGQTELTGFDEVAIKNVALVNSELDIDSVQISRPRAIAGREANGSLVAGGIRLVTPPAPSAAESAGEERKRSTPDVQLSTSNGDKRIPLNIERGALNVESLPADHDRSPASENTTAPTKAFVVVLKKLSVEDSIATWSDAAVSPVVNLTTGASVHLGNFVFGRPAAPATLNVVAHADGSADHCVVDGTVSAGLDAQAVHLDIAATGIRAGQLAAYLPPGLEFSLKDGRFRTSVDAGLSKNPAGGLAARLVIGASDFRDGPADPPLFKMDSVRVDVPQIDLPTNALAIKEITATGVETRAEKMPDGTLHLLGLSLGGKAKTDTGLRPAPAAPVDQVAASQPIDANSHGPEASATISIAQATSVADLVAAAHQVLPLVTVDKLDLNLNRLAFADRSRPVSQPLEVNDVHFTNVNRIDCLGKDAASKPPTHLLLTCRVDPIIDRVRIDMLVAPFAKQPTLVIDFTATGVRGDGLTGLVPELKPRLDGSNLTNGSLTAHVESSANWDRRGPLDFDLSRGFDLDFDLTKVYYRGVRDGPILAGVDEVQSEKIRVQPAQSIVHVRTLEITRPIGLISQDDAGIHALGWLLKLPEQQPTGPTTRSAVAIAKEPSTQPVVAAVTPPVPVKPNGEVSIDRLLISGVDAEFNDYAVNPPMTIPINGLEVEVKNLSTLDPFEDRPIRFSAIVNAGKVKLKQRPKAGGGIGGLLGGALAGKKVERPPVMEDRDLFAQIIANGEVSLYPKLHGWAKTSVSGLDLAALEGAANAAGVKLTNGLYDSEVDVKFNPDGSIATDSRFILTDLSLTDGPNGPLAKALNLPIPLDGAIGAVQGADGSIVFPLNVALQPGNISYVGVGVAAASGVSQVMIRAITNAPLKAANDVTSFLGFAGGKKTAQSNTVAIPFQAGSISFDVASQETLRNILKQMTDDSSLTATVTHQLGAGDVAKAAELANPSTEQCDALQQQLRSRKAELLHLRADTAGRARAQLMSLGAAGAAPAMRQLSAIDRELAGVEDSLDQVCDLLRPGAEKQAERRTRTAALQIASLRLAKVRAALLASGLPQIAERVKVVAPRFDPSTEQDGAVMITAVQKK